MNIALYVYYLVSTDHIIGKIEWRDFELSKRFEMKCLCKESQCIFLQTSLTCPDENLRHNQSSARHENSQFPSNAVEAREGDAHES